tara:strand:+ start:218 stop:976 length:759 start_codon:yes stop_codon:yes gene_type:complete
MSKKKQAPKTQGFVVIASRKKSFYVSALNLIESIRDYMPEAKVALFTEEKFMDHRAEGLCDYVLPCGGHFREKMYGMANSPFDETFYIDADCECEHEDISNVFDHLKDNDLVFVKLTKEKDAQRVFIEVNFDHDGKKSSLELCGGVCLYNSSKPIVKDFMQDWYELFLKQNSGDWWPEGYPKSLARWDQFTLWWLINKVEKYKDLKVDIFKDNYRWNWFAPFGFHSNGKHKLVDKPPVIIHYSCFFNKDKEY